MSTSAPPLTLVEFLDARLKEREDAAERAGADRWVHDGAIVHEGRPHEDVVDWVYDDAWDHIALNDPAYVLADIEAKRAIIAEISDMLIVAPSGFGNDQVPINAAIERAAERARVLRLLASPYRDHPDWREEWA